MARILVLATTLWLHAGLSFALDIPKLQTRVTDLAGVLEAGQVAALEEKLRDLEVSDSTQIAVLIIPSLEGEAIEDFTERTATAWRLGQKGRDNGALLLVSMRERRVRIEVGYGVEATLTDARSRRIIETEITPRFRQSDFYGGVDAGVTAMIQTVRGTYQPAARPSRRGGARQSFDWLIFLLVPFLWILGSIGKWGGALIGGAAGTFLAYLLFGVRLLPMSLGGLGGLLAGAALGAIARLVPAGRRGGGFGGPFFPGGGRGGGGGFGGFSGGGFSGGGGGFGGGGASGSW